MAPIRTCPLSTEIPRISGTRSRSTRWVGRTARMASSGSRLCPPASGLAPSPCSAMIRTASSSVSGRRYINGGGFTKSLLRSSPRCRPLAPGRWSSKAGCQPSRSHREGGHAEDVAFGILEPGRGHRARCGNGVLGLDLSDAGDLQVVVLEGHSFGLQGGNFGREIAHQPPDGGVLAVGRPGRGVDQEDRPVARRVHGRRILDLHHGGEAKGPAVERACLLYVGDRYRGVGLSFANHVPCLLRWIRLCHWLPVSSPGHTVIQASSCRGPSFSSCGLWPRAWWAWPGVERLKKGGAVTQNIDDAVPHARRFPCEGAASESANVPMSKSTLGSVGEGSHLPPEIPTMVTLCPATPQA